MVTTESGLQYRDIKIGSGPSPPVGYQVIVNYAYTWVSSTILKISPLLKSFNFGISEP